MGQNRYLPNKPFPAYIFIPGENPHPKKSGGHMEGEAEPKTSPLDQSHPEKSEFLRYSLDLLNHDYFWESHVYLEALWNAHGRVGPVADFLKALIKIAAAGVKIKLSQSENALEHFLRAKELIAQVSATQGDDFLGFDLKKMQNDIDSALKNGPKIFSLHPKWN